MFIRKYWLPMAVFIVALVGVGLYYLQTRPRPPKPPILIVKPVEFEKSPAKAPVGETSQGGHFHEDGTWHEGPHEAEAPVDPASPAEVPEDVELAPDPEWEEYPFGPPDSPLSPEERVEKAWYNRKFMEVAGESVPATPMPTLYRHYFNSDDEYYRATKRKHALDVALNKLVHEISDRLDAKLARVIEAARRKGMGGNQ